MLSLSINLPDASAIGPAAKGAAHTAPAALPGFDLLLAAMSKSAAGGASADAAGAASPQAGPATPAATGVMPDAPQPAPTGWLGLGNAAKHDAHGKRAHGAADGDSKDSDRTVPASQTGAAAQAAVSIVPVTPPAAWPIAPAAAGDLGPGTTPAPQPGETSGTSTDDRSAAKAAPLARQLPAVPTGVVPTVPDGADAADLLADAGHDGPVATHTDSKSSTVDSRSLAKLGASAVQTANAVAAQIAAGLDGVSPAAASARSLAQAAIEASAAATRGPAANADSRLSPIDRRSAPDVAPIQSLVVPILRQADPIASVGMVADKSAASGALTADTDASTMTTQIVQAIHLQWSRGGGDAEIRLAPQYLGNLTVSLRIEHDAVSASLHADVPAVREWIQTHQQQLRDALADQGLRLASLEVHEHAEEARPDAKQKEQAPREDRPKRRRPQPDEHDAEFAVIA